MNDVYEYLGKTCRYADDELHGGDTRLDLYHILLFTRTLEPSRIPSVNRLKSMINLICCLISQKVFFHDKIENTEGEEWWMKLEDLGNVVHGH
jgi:hypothetical protein